MQRVTCIPRSPVFNTPAAVADLSKPFDLTNVSEEQLSAHEPSFGPRATGSGDGERYSRMPVDWFEMGESWSPRLEICVGGPRQMQGMGPDGKYKAPLITANELK